jgi:hypothetical protein
MSRFFSFGLACKLEGNARVFRNNSSEENLRSAGETMLNSYTCH